MRMQKQKLLRIIRRENEMKLCYKRPHIEIEYFENESIITASGDLSSKYSELDGVNTFVSDWSSFDDVTVEF